MFAIAIFSLAYLFFVAASISLNRAKSSKLKELYRQNYFCAKQARKALLRAERLFHSVQLGLFLSAVAAGLSFAIRFDPLLDHRPIELFSIEIPQNIKFLCFCIILGAFLVGNFLAINAARVFALSRPNRTLCYISVPILFFSKFLFQNF
jgi:CBS domain containing-hemolysin-like protein